MAEGDKEKRRRDAGGGVEREREREREGIEREVGGTPENNNCKQSGRAKRQYENEGNRGKSEVAV